MQDRQKLDNVSKAILRLVSTIDKEFNLTDKELDIVIKQAWAGLNKVLDRRYKEIMNKQLIHKIELWLYLHMCSKY